MSVRNMWMQNKDAVIFVYSVDDLQSFEEMDKLATEIKAIYDPENMPILVMIGNKSELINRAITPEKGLSKAQDHRALFFECSAKSG